MGVVGPEEADPMVAIRIVGDDGVENISPNVSAVDIAIAQGTAFEQVELVENEVRVVADSRNPGLAAQGLPWYLWARFRFIGLIELVLDFVLGVPGDDDAVEAMPGLTRFLAGPGTTASTAAPGPTAWRVRQAVTALSLIMHLM